MRTKTIHLKNIKRIAEGNKRVKENNYSNHFPHIIQQPKMKELWDNKEDKEWQNA